MEISDQVAREIATFLNEGVAEDGVVNEWIAALTPEPEHDPLCPWPHDWENPNNCDCELIARVRADQDAKRKAQIVALPVVWHRSDVLAVFDAK